jgi:hypothetical protein
MSTPTVQALSRRVTNGNTPLQRGGESNVAPRVRLTFVGRSVGQSDHVFLGCYPLKFSSHVRMQVVDAQQRPGWRQQYA